MTRSSTRTRRAGLTISLSLLMLLTYAGLVLVPSHKALARPGSDPNSVAWRPDLGNAQVEAKEKDLVLWIQFTGPWCPNCRRMDRNTFIHPSIVAEAREKFVPIKLRSDEFEGLAVSLGLSVLPSTVLVRPNGDVIDKLEGYADPAEFHAFLQRALVRENRVGPKLTDKKPPKSPAPSNIALASYCPVSLVKDHKLLPGRPEIVSFVQGKEYRFATAEARDEFQRQPERFIPVNNGASPVCQVDGGDCRPGDPRWGVVYKGQLFLCADRHELDLFLLSPERYSHVGAADRAQTGDRRGLWALIRPNPIASTPSVGRGLPTTEPLLIQALRIPLNSLRR